ncbi:MAG TPA: hypothetical protein DCY07_07620 [Rhodospirillaceae bacterium]|nr:hypothetical protein [Rhodospirillaceae bacterium]
MPDQYLTAKIHEALKATSGDKKDAQKLLITWAVRDQALLLGLAKPHLKELAATQIDLVLHDFKKSKLGATLSKEDMETLIQSHTKGEKRSAIKVPPPKSSVRQASVMHQLVDAFKKKK